MKTIYYALSLLLLFVSLATQAQEVIYHQDFNTTTTGLTSGFTSSTQSWTIHHTSSGNEAYLETTKAANTLELKGIPVDGLTDVMVSWTGRGFNASPIKLYYRINTLSATGPETEVSTLVENTHSNGWQYMNTGTGIQLPPAGKNAYTLDLKWTVAVDLSKSKNAYYAMDDLVVTGSRDKTIKPMPVKMLYFKGHVQEGGTKLNWSTALEKDNAKFVIERSQDGTKFSKIGEVKGSGNSLITMDYSYTDNKPAPGTNYYRLRQIDLDGKEALSYVVALEVTAVKPSSAPIATVYPTIATETISISLNTMGSATISILDAAGTPVKTLAHVSEQEVVLPVHAFKKGIYFVSVTDGESQKTQRFVKQ